MQLIMIYHTSGSISLGDIEADVQALLTNVDACQKSISAETVMGLIKKIKELSTVLVARSGWTTERPTETGLYAVIEGGESIGSGNRGIYTVKQDASGQMVYGGMRYVSHACDGTLWHRIADLPVQKNTECQLGELTPGWTYIEPENGASFVDSEICGCDHDGNVLLWCEEDKHWTNTYIPVCIYSRDGLTDDKNDRVNALINLHPDIEEFTIMGLNENGFILMWDAFEKVIYTRYERIGEFGDDGLSDSEKARVKRDGN